MNVTYQLVWQSCAEAPELAERFFAPRFTGHLPFLLAGSGVPPDPASFTVEQLLDPTPPVAVPAPQAKPDTPAPAKRANRRRAGRAA